MNIKSMLKTALGGVVSSSIAAGLMLGQLNFGVEAAGTELKKFIDVGDLNTADTKYGLTTGRVLQKVYFGSNPSLLIHDNLPYFLVDKGTFNAILGEDNDNEITQVGEIKYLVSGDAYFACGVPSVPQGWYIAGYQKSGYGEDLKGGGLVLMCALPHIMIPEFTTEGMTFLPAYSSSDTEKQYSEDWKCSYDYGESPGAKGTVYANYYGASEIRSTLKDYKEDTNRFTKAEQRLMMRTPVHTYDAKNGKYYSTNDYLFLGTGENGRGYFTVGANKVDSSDDKMGNAKVNNGLSVGTWADTSPKGSPFSLNAMELNYWLRSPGAEANLAQFVNGSDGVIQEGNVTRIEFASLAPACALNIETLKFASAAEPCCEDAEFDEDGMYFRFAGTNEISSTVTASGNTITVTKGDENIPVYLYVQGNDGRDDWIYSKQITKNETINTSAVKSSLSNFNDCKVWLEIRKDNVAYAKMAVDTTQTANAIVQLKYPSRDITDLGGVKLTLTNGSGDTTVGQTGWNVNGSTFTSKEAVEEGVYTLKIDWEGVNLVQNEFKIRVAQGHSTVITVVRSRAFTGTGGEAAYKSESGKTILQCNLSPGYKLNSVQTGPDGTNHIGFKKA